MPCEILATDSRHSSPPNTPLPLHILVLHTPLEPRTPQRVANGPPQIDIELQTSPDELDRALGARSRLPESIHVEIRVHDELDGFARHGVAEGQVAGAEGVDDDAEGPDVARRLVQLAVHRQAFRRGVLERADDGGGRAEVLARVVVVARVHAERAVVELLAGVVVHAAAVEEVCEAEVAEAQVATFGFGVGSGKIDEAVLEFDVAVAHANVFVEVSQCASELVGVAVCKKAVEPL